MKVQIKSSVVTVLVALMFVGCGVSKPERGQANSNDQGGTGAPAQGLTRETCSQATHASITGDAELKTLHVPVLLPCSVASAAATASALAVDVTDANNAEIKFNYNGFPVQISLTASYTDSSSGTAETKVEARPVPAQFQLEVSNFTASCNANDEGSGQQNTLNFKITGFNYAYSVVASRKEAANGNSCLNEAQLRQMVNKLTRVIFPASEPTE